MPGVTTADEIVGFDYAGANVPFTASLAATEDVSGPNNGDGTINMTPGAVYYAFRPDVHSQAFESSVDQGLAEKIGESQRDAVHHGFERWILIGADQQDTFHMPPFPNSTAGTVFNKMTMSRQKLLLSM